MMSDSSGNQQIALLGNDARVLAVAEIVRRVADAEATVLIHGETGTGKEVVARMLHVTSCRSREPFVAVNCGALPESLLESELFGATKGAYTGALTSRTGKFEAAQRGTIFLDEVASMSQPMQVALLRVLQSGEFTPIGTSTPRVSQARVVAAVNTDLSGLVAEGTFRADLYYRLNVIQIDLPPLRERRDDVLVLADHFLATFAAKYGKRGLTLSDGARACLRHHQYPGNVRELENAIHRAVVLTEGLVVGVHDLPPQFVPVRDDAGDRWRAKAFHHAKAVHVARFEREFLSAALEQTRGVVVDAARRVGLSERVFHIKLRKYGMRTLQ